MNKLEGDRLLSLVRDMRNCQKEYFKTRSSDTLKHCKALEKQVDALVAELEKPMRQGSLL